MLRQLLRLVEAGPPRTAEELSRALGVDRQLVCAMLDHLVSIGRIEQAELRSTGATACAGCPIAGRCAVRRPAANPRGQ